MVYDGSDDSKTFQYHITTENTGPLSQILESGRQYMFQVRAMNVDANNFVSVGPFSDPQLFTVRDPRPPLFPSSEIKKHIPFPHCSFKQV